LSEKHRFAHWVPSRRANCVKKSVIERAGRISEPAKNRQTVSLAALRRTVFLAPRRLTPPRIEPAIEFLAATRAIFQTDIVE
jgi:hypothetical protein